MLNQTYKPTVIYASKSFIDRYSQFQEWIKMGQKGELLILKDALLRKKEYWKGKKRKILPLPK